jgi:hypothetical protein
MLSIPANLPQAVTKQYYKEIATKKNRSRAKEIAVFSLLHEKVDLDLDLDTQMMKKREELGLESVYLTFAVSSFNKPRAKLSP